MVRSPSGSTWRQDTAEVTETTSIRMQADVPVGQVWSVLSDYFGLAGWASAIAHSSAMTATPAGMGASRRVATTGGVLIENVVDWNPLRAIAYEIVGLPSVVIRVENRWELRPSGTGTSVTLTGVIEPGPKPAMRVAAKVIARRLGQVNESMVSDLIAAAGDAA